MFKLANANRSIKNAIKYRKKNFFRHVMRHDSLQGYLLEGKIEGKGAKGDQDCSVETLYDS